VFVALARHLLARRQHGLDLAEVDEHVARIVLLLDHSADDVSLAAGVLAERQLVLGITQALQDDLFCGARRDPVEVVGGVFKLANRGAVVVHLDRDHRHLASAAIDARPRMRVCAFCALIRNQQRRFDRLDQQIEGDVLLALEAAQRGHVDVHRASSPSRSGVETSDSSSSKSSASSIGDGRLNSTCTRPGPSSSWR
jgi:hypothetical protein